MFNQNVYEQSPTVSPELKVIEILADQPWTYETTKEEFRSALHSGTRRFLIDKRAHLTPLDKPQSVATARELGQCLDRMGAKMAFVLNEDDHAEKVMCLAIMQAGGQVLSTFELSEAVKWLNDEIH